MSVGCEYVDYSRATTPTMAAPAATIFWKPAVGAAPWKTEVVEAAVGATGVTEILELVVVAATGVELLLAVHGFHIAEVVEAAGMVLLLVGYGAQDCHCAEDEVVLMGATGVVLAVEEVHCTQL